MSGYLNFNQTGEDEVDNIVNIMNQIGSMYHSTSDWNEEYEENISCHEAIQCEINFLAKTIKKLKNNYQSELGDL